MKQGHMNPMDEQARQARVLRAEMAHIRLREKYAYGAWIGGFMACMVIWRLKELHLSHALKIDLTIVVAVLAVAAQVPLLAFRCPQCKKRFHDGFGLLLGPFNATKSCRHCGFDMDKRRSRYS